MVIKSRKIRQQQIEMPARGPTLAEMKQEIKRRKRAQRKKVDWVGGAMKVVRGMGKATKYLDKSLTDQARKMPSEKDLNKELWG